MNLRDQILIANDRKTVRVPTPEWGADVHVRTLSAAEVQGYQAKVKTIEDQGLRVGLLAATIICDEAGNPVFTDDDAAALATKSAAVLDRVAEAHVRLNATGAEEIRAIEKNSSTPPNSN